MNFNRLRLALLTAVSFSLILTSCDPKEEKNNEDIYNNGVFIPCEGFNNNGSVSYYSYTTDSVYNNIFQSKNGRILGEFVQSIHLTENRAYIVVNGSDKVEVAERSSFAELGTISNLSSPRYMVSSGSTGYISCWGNGSIAVVDLTSNQVITSLKVGIGPEKMLIDGNNLLVANSNGTNFEANDSTISIIDTETNTLTGSINLGAYNPTDIEKDAEGNIWVLCRGEMNWTTFSQTASELVKLSKTDYSVLDSYVLSETSHPENLSINPQGNKLYYGKFFMVNNIYEVNISNPTESVLFYEGATYGFEVNPENGNVFILINAPDFASNGSLKRLSPSGELLGTYTTGINGNGASFKKAD